MRVSLNWLKELLPAEPLDAQPLKDLAYTLDMTGTAVEAIHTSGEALEGVIIGQVVEKTKHPDADKLWVTKVDIGGPEPLQIVCGAQNFEAGDKIPVAVVGAELPGDIKIKKAKMRGIESQGMNCSGRELGVDGDASGLLILPADAPIGVKFTDYHGTSDTVLELEITPNRPDCLSMVGVAREFGAVLHADPIPLPAPVLSEGGAPADTAAHVTIADPDLCFRYMARVIRGVKVGPSPAWLAERVEAAGVRSISNVVDVTNYIMMLYGQPLHAFDLATIAPGEDNTGRAHVIIRRAVAGERITTLDGVDRALTPKNLLITDATGPITLAGVMGAEATEISDATVDVFLEAAVFDSATTSRTSRSLALISESSMRFERGVDRTATPVALDAAAALIAEVAGGVVAPGAIDEYPRPFEPTVLTLCHDFLAGTVGTDISLEEAAAILRPLGFAVELAESGDVIDEPEGGVGGPAQRGDTLAAPALLVTVPAFRMDVTREIDLVEEVLRLWGMERVPATLPGGRKRIGGLTKTQQLRNTAGRALRAAGLCEAVTYPFGEPTDLERLGWELPADELLVELHNPMSAEQASLRRTLLPSLLRAAATNHRFDVANVALYEMGKIYWTAAGRKLPKERETVCGVLTGSWIEPTWAAPQTPIDFYDAKGILESLAWSLKVERLSVRAVREGERPWLQPGRGADIMVRGDVIGWVGELHPTAAASFDIDSAVVAFEFDLGRLLAAAKDTRGFSVPPRFPAIDRDIALVVDDAVTHEDIERRITSLGKKAPLESVRLFDVYRGKGIEPGKKSMAYTLSYRLPDRTLTGEEVEAAHSSLVERLMKDIGATMRG